MPTNIDAFNDMLAGRTPKATPWDGPDLTSRTPKASSPSQVDIPGAPAFGPDLNLGKYGQNIPFEELESAEGWKGERQGDLMALTTGLAAGVVNTAVGTAQGIHALVASPLVLLNAMGPDTIKESIIDYIESPSFQGYEEAKEAIRQTLPVHRSNSGFHPLEALGANIENILTSVSLMIPAWGGTRLAAGLLSNAGRAMGLANTITGLSPLAKNLARGLSMAAISRPIESMLEADQTGKSTYQHAIAAGMSEEEAIKAKHTAMGMAMQFNSYLFAMDALQGAFMLPGFSGMNKILDKNFMTKLMASMASEGAEEGIQFGMSKEAERLGLADNSPMSEMDLMGRAVQYASDPDFWSSVGWGAVGGGVMTSVPHVMDAVFKNAIDPLRTKLDKEYKETKQMMEEVEEIITKKAAATSTSALSKLDDEQMLTITIPQLSKVSLNSKGLDQSLIDLKNTASKSEEELTQQQNPDGSNPATLFGQPSTFKANAEFGVTLAEEAKKLREQAGTRISIEGTPEEQQARISQIGAYVQDGLAAFYLATKANQLSNIQFSNIDRSLSYTTEEAKKEAKLNVQNAAAQEVETLAGKDLNPILEDEFANIYLNSSPDQTADPQAYQDYVNYYTAKNQALNAEAKFKTWQSTTAVGKKINDRVEEQKKEKEAREQQAAERQKAANTEKAVEILRDTNQTLLSAMQAELAALPKPKTNEEKQAQIQALADKYKEHLAKASSAAKASLSTLGDFSQQLRSLETSTTPLDLVQKAKEAEALDIPLEAIKALAKKISEGQPATSPEELQLQANYPKQLEAELVAIANSKPSSNTSPTPSPTPLPTPQPTEEVPTVNEPGIPNPPDTTPASNALVDSSKNNRLSFWSEEFGKGVRNFFNEAKEVILTPTFKFLGLGPNENNHNAQFLDPSVVKVGTPLELFVPTSMEAWKMMKAGKDALIPGEVKLTPKTIEQLATMTVEQVMKPTADQRDTANMVTFAPIGVKLPGANIDNPAIQLPYSNTGLTQDLIRERLSLRLAMLQRFAKGNFTPVPTIIQRTQQGAFPKLPERQPVTQVLRNPSEVGFAIKNWKQGRMEVLGDDQAMMDRLQAADQQVQPEASGWVYMIVPTFDSDVQANRTGLVPLWKRTLSQEDQNTILFLLQNLSTLQESRALEVAGLLDKEGKPTHMVNTAIGSMLYHSTDNTYVIQIKGTSYSLRYYDPSDMSANKGWNTINFTEQDIQPGSEIEALVKQVLSKVMYNVEKREGPYQRITIKDGQPVITNVPMKELIGERTETSLPTPRVARDLNGNPKVNPDGSTQHIYVVHPAIHIDYVGATQAASTQPQQISAPVQEVSTPVPTPNPIPSPTPPTPSQLTSPVTKHFSNEEVEAMLEDSALNYDGSVHNSVASDPTAWEYSNNRPLLERAYKQWQASEPTEKFEKWLKAQQEGSPLEIPYQESPNTAELMQRLQDLRDDPFFFNKIFLKEILLSPNQELSALGYKLWPILKNKNIQLRFKSLPTGNVARAVGTTIYVDPDQIPLVGRHFSYILAHESVHLVQDSVIKNPKTPAEHAYKEAITKIMRQSHAILQNFPNISKHTGDRAIMEFLAESRSNPELIRQLKTKYPDRNLFQRLWDAFLELIGWQKMPTNLYEFLTTTMNNQLAVTTVAEGLNSNLEVPTSVNYTHLWEGLQTINTIALGLVNDTNIGFDKLAIYHDTGGAFDQLEKRIPLMDPEAARVARQLLDTPDAKAYIIEKSWSFLNQNADFINEGAEDEEGTMEETGERALIQKAAFEVSAKVKASKAARAMLSRIYQQKAIKDPKTGAIRGYRRPKDMFGFERVIPFDTMWNQLAISLADHSTDEILPTLHTLAEVNPNMKAILDAMLNISEQHRTEFKAKFPDYTPSGQTLFGARAPLDREAIVTEFQSLFTKQLGKFLSISFNNGEVRDANWHSATRLVTGQWYEAYKEGDLTIFTELGPQPNLPRIKAIKEQFEKDKATRGREPAFYIETLNKIGISMPEVLVKQITEHPELFKFLGKKYSKSSADITGYLGTATSDIINAMAEKNTEVNDRVSHPFTKRSNDIERLARMKLMVDPTIHSDMFRSQSGKNIYTVNQPTLLSDRMQKLERGEVDGLYAQNPFSQDNYFLPAFAQKQTPLKLYYTSTFGKTGNHEDYNDLSIPDRWIARLMLFNHSGNEEGYFETPQHADKPVVPIIKAPKRTVGFTNGALDPATHSIIQKNIILSEMKRIAIAYHQFQTQPKELLVENYHVSKKGPGAATKFQFFHQHGLDLNTLTVKSPSGTEMSFLDYTRSIPIDQVSNIESMHLAPVQEALKGFINEYMQREYAELRKELLGFGILKTQIDQLSEQEEDVILEELKQKNGLRVDNAQQLLADFTVNYWIMNASYYQLISGDPAFAKPDDNGFVAVDLFKRLAMDIAPGMQSTLQGDMNLVISEDYEATSALVPHWANELKKILKDDPQYKDYSAAELDKAILELLSAFTKINNTDAQALVSMDEYAKLLQGWGRLTTPMQTLIQKAKDGKLTLKESTELALQVLKPVIVTEHWDERLQTTVRDYIKISVLPAIPQIMQGSPYQKLFEAQTDMGWLVYKSGVKLGASNIMKLQDWSSPNIVETVNSHIHKIPYKGLKLQQETPYEKNKKEIRTVSQARKLLFQDLIDLLPTEEAEKIRLDGHTWKSTITSLKRHYDQLFIANIEDAIDELKYEFGMDFSQDRPVITNIRKVNELLEEEMTKRGYSENMKQALQLTPVDGVTMDQAGLPLMQFRIPLYITPTSLEFEGLLYSIISNKLVKQKRAGKSFIQASPYGILKPRHISTVIPPSALKQLKEDKAIPEQTLYGTFVNAEDLLEPGEILLPAVARKFLKGRKDISLKELQEIGADRVFGMRIPNQGHSSMAAFKVKGFLPEAVGDLIIIHPEIIAQMGSDFDVDKLYVYFPHLRTVRDGKRKFVEKVPYIPRGSNGHTYYEDATKTTVNISDTEARYWAKVRERMPRIMRILEKEYAPEIAEINRLAKQYEQEDWYKKAIQDAIEARTEQLVTNPSPEIENTAEAEDKPFFSNILQYLDELVVQSDIENLKEARAWRRENNKKALDELEEARKGQTLLQVQFSREIKVFNKILQNLAYEKMVALQYIPASIDDFAQWTEEKQNTRRARENRMLSIELGIFERKPMLKKLTEANSIEPWKEAIVEMTGSSLDALRPPSNPLSILASDKAWRMNLAAKSGVATASLWSTWASQMQYNPLELQPFDEEVFQHPGVKFSKDNKVVGTPIEGSELIHAHFGLTQFSPRHGSFGPTRITYLNQVIQSVMVDDAKNQVAALGNLGDATLSTALFLINMGVNDLNYIAGFLMQPAIVEFAKRLNASGSVLDDYEEDRPNAIILEIENEYKQALQTLKAPLPSPAYTELYGDVDIKAFSLKELKDNIQPQETIEHLQTQFEAIKAWRYYYNLAVGNRRTPGMIQLIGALNIDTKGVGKNFFDVYNRTKRVNDIMEQKTWTNLSIALQGTTFTKLADILTKARTVYTNREHQMPILPYSMAIFDMFYKDTTQLEFMTEDIAMEAAEGAYAYMTSHINSGLYPEWVQTAKDMQDYRQQLMFPKEIPGDKTTYDKSTTLYARVRQAREKNPGKFWILERLSVNDKETTFDALEFHRNTVELAEHDLLIASLSQMLNDPDHQQLAKDIIAYSFLTKGVSMSTTGYTHLIPLGYLASQYAKFFREDAWNVFNQPEHVSRFKEQWFRNFPKRAKKVKKVPSPTNETEITTEFVWTFVDKKPALFKREVVGPNYGYRQLPSLGAKNKAYTLEFNANGDIDSLHLAPPAPVTAVETLNQTAERPFAPTTAAAAQDQARALTTTDEEGNQVFNPSNPLSSLEEDNITPDEFSALSPEEQENAKKCGHKS